MSIYSGGVIATLILVHIAFIFAIKTKRNDLADVIWGPGFVVAAVGAILGRWLQTGEAHLGPREYLVLIFLSVWAFRLFSHIGLRTLRKSHEDSRYKTMRDNWGSLWVLKTYLYVFILQGVLLFIVDLPILQTVSTAPRPIDAVVGLGILLWMIGFTIEAISDRQLQQFIADPKNKGRIMDRGLWSWSRHPNYFGEVTLWWGFFLMCVSRDTWWLILSPLMMTFLILKVSGVPLLEKLMENRPGFAEYKAKTSCFFPWPPR